MILIIRSVRMLTNFFKAKKYSNWNELEYDIIKSPSQKEKGDIFEDFAFIYFNLNRDFYNIKEIYQAKDIPNEYREKYKLEKKDYGVDGLIIRNSGAAVAYQVKFRSNNQTADYSELSTFWAESEYADERIIFSNCYELPAQASKKKNQMSILMSTLLELSPSFFENVFDFANKNIISAVAAQKYTPREHQKKIIEDVLKGFSSSPRGKVISACGTGKTLTALWIKEALNAKQTLFIVPSLALIKQTLDEWFLQKRIDFDFLCVCSDESVIDKTQLDEFYTNTADLNFPVTTNTEEISKFLNSQSENKIVFSTYQSLGCIVSAMMNTPGFKFDLGIFDEAHRTAGSKDSDMFVFAMEDTYIPIEKRLFMTATERVVSPRVKKLIEQTEYSIFSMDDEQKYGQTFSRLNFGEAIEKGIISDYKIIVSCIKESEIKAMVDANRYVASSENGMSSAEMLFKQSILANIFKTLNVKKVISYHSSIDKANKFINGATNIFPLNTVIENTFNIDNLTTCFKHINGNTKSSERYQIFNQFKSSDIGVLSNAKCLTEGVDIPIVDAVYFVDHKNSIIDIIQAIGRALRKSEQKTISYIILPLVVPETITDFSKISPEQFETLHNVIQSLREQDSRLADSIDELNLCVARNSFSGRKNTTIDDKLKIILPENIDIGKFTENILIRIAEVNKNPTSAKITISNSIENRSSNYTRVFTTIGDYTLESYINSCVKPTMEKFDDYNSEYNSTQLKVNHNNVSHTERIGVIEKCGSLYKLTPLGMSLAKNEITYEELVKLQMLRYYSVNRDGKLLFPYRAFLKVMMHFDYITRFEFLYAIYTITSSDDAEIEKAIERINYIRNTYPNIDILSEENKKKVLSILNTSWGYDFSFADIWTSRTTTYNQFNYFKKHLLIFDSIFENNASNKNQIIKKYESNSKIELLLTNTQYIEKANISEVKQMYKQKK